MATTDRFALASPRFTREASASALLGGAEKGRPLSPPAKRNAAVATFAAHLDLLAREDRTGRKAAAQAPSNLGADALSTGADGAAGAGAGDSDVRIREETNREWEDRRDGALLASDDAALGRDAIVDPMVQVLGALAPRSAPPIAAARPEPAQPDVRTPIEQLMARLVRRVAWSGNARAGVARLELGAGELEGATLTIHADDGRVRVALDLPPGVDRAAWKERISERLALRGLQVEAVDVG
jgi:hypothetical protein